MSRKFVAPAAVAALTLTALLVSPAGAVPPEAESPPTKDVPVSETGSYVVVMAADPVAITVGQDNVDTPNGEAQSAVLEASQEAVLDSNGLGAVEPTNQFTVSLNGFSAQLSHEEAERLAADSRVAVVLPDFLRQKAEIPASGGGGWWSSTDSLNDFLGLTGRDGAYADGITGEGVVVGVIDSGIWPENPMFADDGTMPAAPVLDNTRPSCDFGNTAANPLDAPFTCNNKLVGARQMLDTYRALIPTEPFEFDSARDADGHGSHTASTAAGNANVQAVVSGRVIDTVSGIAPRAQIIAYKGLGDQGGFTSDLAAAIDQAVADGVDVINYSIGGGAGPIGADDLAFLFAADAGVFVATSAGNSGPGASTIGSPAILPWVTTVGASTQERFYEGTIRLGNGRTIRGSSVTRGIGSKPLVDAADVLGNPLCLPGVWDADDLAGKVVLCERGAVGRVAKSLAVHEAGGVGMIMFNIDVPNQDNLYTDNFWVPTVHIDQVDGNKIKAYIDSASWPRASIVNTAKITKTPWNYPSMTVFSSRGPNPSFEDIIKPDITAPGIQVLAAASPAVAPDFPQGQNFQAIAGTSMSSPVMAGVFALLKQAHPDWSPAAAKSAVMTSAHQDVVDNDRKSQADPFDFGSGHVNPGRVDKKGSMFNPGLVYDAGFLEYLGFMCEADPSIFANPAGTCATLVGLGVPTRVLDLNLASIGMGAVAGSETVLRTVTNVAGSSVTYKADIKSPKGYKVTVSPSTLTLAPGASATVEITATNTGSGPVGEWRFGSLTWKGGGYSVRSPIAVRGTQIAVEPTVSAAGAAGTADIAVKFGYTGAYVPEASGLVPSTVLAGDISQDPDQTFNPGDPASDGVDLIPIEMTNASYARIELAIPGADDIDLYLLDSTGTIVAASTAGGTDELIELSYPTSGTYTLAVHGWSVPSAPLSYAIDTWVVPNSAGSLTIASAPAAATIGTAGIVTVSWAGLPSGRHFGAVAHTDGSNVLAQTIVEVEV
ncbi:MAG: S8 family serine peptidase [Actinomycetota bacterium]|nr:S8 family serine peptidase [Actinomycetota bacterium]